MHHSVITAFFIEAIITEVRHNMSGYKVEICGVNTAKLPLLSSKEKEELFEKILKGDKDARERYIKGNLRLVLSVIQRFSGMSGEFR